MGVSHLSEKVYRWEEKNVKYISVCTTVYQYVKLISAKSTH